MYLGTVNILISIVTDPDSIQSNKVSNALFLNSPSKFHNFSCLLLCITLCEYKTTHKQSCSVPKISLNVNLHGFDAIGCHMFVRLHG